MATLIRSTLDRDLPQLRAALGDACPWLDIPTILREKLGPSARGEPASALTATIDEAACGIAIRSGNRLRLLAVAVDRRGLGVGSRLLEEVERAARADRVEELSVLDEAGNYAAPGILTGDRGTIEWLERRGYRRSTTHQSLLVPLADFTDLDDRAQRSVRQVEARGYAVRRGRADDVELLDRVAADYSPAWRAETARALSGPSPTVFVATRHRELAGFAVHDGNNRGLGWFGPAATWPAHRGNGIGRALLYASLIDIRAAGLDSCTISWIGPRAFYERACGPLEVLDFEVLRKPLK